MWHIFTPSKNSLKSYLQYFQITYKFWKDALTYQKPFCADCGRVKQSLDRCYEHEEGNNNQEHTIHKARKDLYPAEPEENR